MFVYNIAMATELGLIGLLLFIHLNPGAIDHCEICRGPEKCDEDIRS